MKRNQCIKMLFAAAAICAAGNVSAQESAGMLPALTRQVVAAEKLHRQEQAAATLVFEWEKPVYLSDTVRRPRRPGFRDVLVKTERQTTACRGVLLAGENRILTTASCAQAPSGFSLKKVRVQLANGRRGSGLAGSVSINGNFAGVAVSSRLTEGLQGVPVAAVPEGETLYEVFGKGVQQKLLEFFVNRGVVSPRASRLAGVKNTLQKGEPFFYQGKVVALVNEVPRRLPVSFWGGVSEEHLAVFHTGIHDNLLAAK